MLIGNVGNDPEVRYLESNPQNPNANVKVASFRLATSERYRDRNGEQRENTEWHNIVVWRGNADVVEKFVHKGTQLYIEGKLRTRQWTDQTGNKRYTTEVVADTLQLLGRRPDGQGDAAPQGGYGPAQSGSGYQGGYQGPGYQGGQGGFGPAQSGSGYQGPGYQGGYGQSQPNASPSGQPAQPNGYQGAQGAQSGQPAQPQGNSGPVQQPGSGFGQQPGQAQQSGPAVNPEYQGPLPAAEPSDDLPF